MDLNNSNYVRIPSCKLENAKYKRFNEYLQKYDLKLAHYLVEISQN